MHLYRNKYEKAYLQYFHASIGFNPGDIKYFVIWYDWFLSQMPYILIPDKSQKHLIVWIKPKHTCQIIPAFYMHVSSVYTQYYQEKIKQIMILFRNLYCQFIFKSGRIPSPALFWTLFLFSFLMTCKTIQDQNISRSLNLRASIGYNC